MSCAGDETASAEEAADFSRVCLVVIMSAGVLDLMCNRLLD